MFYSSSTNGFYSSDIHGDSVPADVVSITVEDWNSLLEGQSLGKKITADSDGKPILVEHVQPVEEK